MTTLTRTETAAIRQATRHDAVLGSDSFVQQLESLQSQPAGQALLSVQELK